MLSKQFDFFSPCQFCLAFSTALFLSLTGCRQGTTEPGSSTVLKSTSRNNSASVLYLPPGVEKTIGPGFDVAARRLLDFYVTIPGEVRANANLVTHVNAQISGRAQEVRASVGDHVHDGQVLVLIRSTDIEQAEADLLQNLAQIQADEKRDLMQIDFDIKEAEAALKLSTSAFARQDTLMQEKIAARAQYEEAKTQLQKDQITLDALKKKHDTTIQLSEEKMDLTRENTRQKLRLLGVPEGTIDKVMQSRQINPLVPVVSPKDGVVTERSINVGELVDPGKPLFTIADLHSVWLTASVYEKDMSKVADGQPIELTVEGFPGKVFKGTLNFVAESVNPDTRTLSVRAEVANPGVKLKPDMFGTMKILVGKQVVLTVPSSAIQDAGDSQVVYVPLGQGNYEERPIKPGAKAGDYAEILKGLAPGEKVVSKGSFELRSAFLEKGS